MMCHALGVPRSSDWLWESSLPRTPCLHCQHRNHQLQVVEVRPVMKCPLDLVQPSCIGQGAGATSESITWGSNSSSFKFSRGSSSPLRNGWGFLPLSFNWPHTSSKAPRLLSHSLLEKSTCRAMTTRLRHSNLAAPQRSRVKGSHPKSLSMRNHFRAWLLVKCQGFIDNRYSKVAKRERVS